MSLFTSTATNEGRDLESPCEIGYCDRRRLCNGRERHILRAAEAEIRCIVVPKLQG